MTRKRTPWGIAAIGALAGLAFSSVIRRACCGRPDFSNTTEPLADVVELGAVASRLANQAHDHWREFSVIVATGGVAGVVVATARALTREFPPRGKLLVVAMAVTTGLAVAIAYYGIQTGAAFLRHPLRLLDVVTSFAIATSQVCMIGWLAYVTSANRSYSDPRELRLELRPWVAFQALFALAAALANWHSAYQRQADGLIVPDYEARQHSDRISSALVGAVLLTASAATAAVPELINEAVAWAAVIAPAAGMSYALVNQDRAIRALRMGLPVAAHGVGARDRAGESK